MQIIRRANTITLLAPDYSVTVEVSTRGIELDATTVERMLHAPLGVIAELLSHEAALSSPNKIASAESPSARPYRVA